jgi:hypothetical protein
MTEQLVKQPAQRPPTHPGEILREDVLPSLGICNKEHPALEKGENGALSEHLGWDITKGSLAGKV